MMALSPLFIPLRTEYYRAFEDGSKTAERRIYGKRWNENTCVLGRRVTISKGYGRAERMHGIVIGFKRVAFSELAASDKASLMSVYGDNPGDIAEIRINLE